MKKYNDEEYTALINILINDAFYVEGVSYDTKIFQIRKYTEIIVRRLLQYPINKDLTLGRGNVKKRVGKERIYRRNISRCIERNSETWKHQDTYSRYNDCNRTGISMRNAEFISIIWIYVL